MSLRRGSSVPTAEGSDPPYGSGPPTRVEPIYRRGGVRGATCPAGVGAGASLPLEDSPTHHIQCGWLRRALLPRLAGQPLSDLTVDRVLPRYTVSRLRHIRAEPVCCINWIRWHSTFPSCHLRRKLHGRFDKTGQSTPVGRFPRTNQGNPGMKSPSPTTP